MKTLPASPDLAHLKKQAKRLLRDAKARELSAVERFLAVLPSTRDLDASMLAKRELKLHDAQSVISREYGFRSWLELKRYVEWKASAKSARLSQWLNWTFDGTARQRDLAVRVLSEDPDLFRDDPWLACVTGDVSTVRSALAHDSGFAHRPGGPYAMPPLVAVTHSRLISETMFEAGLLACAQTLIDHGADTNGSWSDPRWPGSVLSALYGAAGRTHHAGMTKLMLEAGASPNDNESLYHSLESRDVSCTKLLLDAGARVAGTNSIGRVLDYDKLDALKLLLRHDADLRENTWVHHAILRGRSLDHIRALVDAGADLQAKNSDGVSVTRWAAIHGRMDIVELAQDHGIEEHLSIEEQFVSLCAQGNDAAARAILSQHPDIYSRLVSWQLETMPRLASLGDIRAVETMLVLGWPREVKSGWDATALNLAVFQGDAAMARALLHHGADWRTQHGYCDTVLGTLSFASQSDEIGDPAPRDYVGCARALIDNGVPLSAFGSYVFAPDVMDFLDSQSESMDA